MEAVVESMQYYQWIWQSYQYDTDIRLIRFYKSLYSANGAFISAKLGCLLHHYFIVCV